MDILPWAYTGFELDGIELLGFKDEGFEDVGCGDDGFDEGDEVPLALKNQIREMAVTLKI